MPEWEAFIFVNCLKMGALYLKNGQYFGVLLEELIQLLLDNCIHRKHPVDTLV